jgi:hypothetical protein
MTTLFDTYFFATTATSMAPSAPDTQFKFLRKPITLTRSALPQQLNPIRNIDQGKTRQNGHWDWWDGPSRTNPDC